MCIGNSKNSENSRDSPTSNNNVTRTSTRVLSGFGYGNGGHYTYYTSPSVIYVDANYQYHRNRFPIGSRNLHPIPFGRHYIGHRYNYR